MALLFMDGFDHYATADITKKWNSKTGTISSSAGRRGGGAYVNGSDQYLGKQLSSSYSTLIFGFAFYPTLSTVYTRTFLQLFEGTTTHLTFTINTSGKIVVRLGGTSGSVLATSAAILKNVTWQYIEIKVNINSTTGSVQLKIDGVTDANINLSGINTRNGGTAGAIDNFYFGLSGNGSQFNLDDFYVCDTSGAANNDFLGDCRIDTLLPSGDGNYTQFSPSTGTAHYATVDETTPNTTDYNYSSTSGDRDSYTFPDLTGLVSQTVYGIQINAAALKSDSGSRSLGTMSRLSGTNKDGAGAALSTSLAYLSEIQETDPASVAWTEANVNAAEFGVKVTA